MKVFKKDYKHSYKLCVKCWL